MDYRHQITSGAAIAALRRIPAVMEAHIGGAAYKGAGEVAQEMRLTLAKNRSVARAHLVNSINVHQAGRMGYDVVVGSDHARMVEEGTGPAAGRKSYLPNRENLEDYIKQRGKIVFSGRPGSKRRVAQEAEIRDRAMALAVHIRKYGTKPHPFAEPSLQAKKSRLFELFEAATVAGLAEVFGA